MSECCVGTTEAREVIRSLDLELEMILRCLIRMLETKPGCSRKLLRSLYHRIIPLVLSDFILHLFVFDIVSMYRSGWPRIGYVDHPGLKLTKIFLPLTSKALELKACITKLNQNEFFDYVFKLKLDIVKDQGTLWICYGQMS